jgi:hypothetical protein
MYGKHILNTSKQVSVEHTDSSKNAVDVTITRNGETLAQPTTEYKKQYSVGDILSATIKPSYTFPSKYNGGTPAGWDWNISMSGSGSIKNRSIKLRRKKNPLTFNSSPYYTFANTVSNWNDEHYIGIWNYDESTSHMNLGSYITFAIEASRGCDPCATFNLTTPSGTTYSKQTRIQLQITDAEAAKASNGKLTYALSINNAPKITFSYNLPIENYDFPDPITIISGGNTHNEVYFNGYNWETWDDDNNKIATYYPGDRLIFTYNPNQGDYYFVRQDYNGVLYLLESISITGSGFSKSVSATFTYPSQANYSDTGGSYDAYNLSEAIEISSAPSVALTAKYTYRKLCAYFPKEDSSVYSRPDYLGYVSSDAGSWLEENSFAPGDIAVYANELTSFNTNGHYVGEGRLTRIVVTGKISGKQYLNKSSYEWEYRLWGCYEPVTVSLTYSGVESGGTATYSKTFSGG